jgi:DNA-binding MarR family transcriptional regulator
MVTDFGVKATFTEQVTTYLTETLGIEVAFLAYPEASNLPYRFTEQFEIKRVDILGKSFLALCACGSDLTPSSIEKQTDWLYEKTGLRCLLIMDSMAAYNRKRLIERKIPFVVPGNQLYLPDLGLDLREHLKKVRQVVSKLSPASQVVVLGCLLRRIKPEGELTPTALAEQFGYTKMTMSRALDELRALQLVDRSDSGSFGRSRFVTSGRELWQKARPFLRTPVKKRVYLDEWFDGSKFRAGETALEEKTLLASSRRAVWAVTSEDWKHLPKPPYVHIIPEVSKEMAHAEFEIWHYDPGLLTEPPDVDPLSLALSLSDESDERVGMAVDELLRGVSW